MNIYKNYYYYYYLLPRWYPPPCLFEAWRARPPRHVQPLVVCAGPIVFRCCPSWRWVLRGAPATSTHAEKIIKIKTNNDGPRAELHDDARVESRGGGVGRGHVPKTRQCRVVVFFFFHKPRPQTLHVSSCTHFSFFFSFLFLIN